MSQDKTFSVPLCGCCESHPFVCFASTFCLPCVISENSANLDGTQNCCLCCYPGNPWKNRFQARAKFNIEESRCADCALVCCCPCLSENQIAREIIHRRATGHYCTHPQQQSMA